MDNQTNRPLSDDDRLDSLLASVEAPAPSMDLRQRILSKAKAVQETTPWQWMFDWLSGETLTQAMWRPALAFALPLCFGLTLGLNFSMMDTSTETAFTEEESHLLAMELEDWLDE